MAVMLAPQGHRDTALGLPPNRYGGHATQSAAVRKARDGAVEMLASEAVALDARPSRSRAVAVPTPNGWRRYQIRRHRLATGPVQDAEAAQPARAI